MILTRLSVSRTALTPLPTVPHENGACCTWVRLLEAGGLNGKPRDQWLDWAAFSNQLHGARQPAQLDAQVARVHRQSQAPRYPAGTRQGPPLLILAGGGLSDLAVPGRDRNVDSAERAGPDDGPSWDGAPSRQPSCVDGDTRLLTALPLLIGDICVGDDLPYVPVLALEVEPASLMTVVDLAIRP